MGDHDSQRQRPRRLSGAAADDGAIFARHYQTLDHDSEIPPEDACRTIGAGRAALYSPGEISALIDAAGRFAHRCGR